MASEMVELVEKAIRKAAAGHYEESLQFISQAKTAAEAQTMMNRVGFSMATAAIEAMREPTEAMLKAGNWRKGDWLAMIDAALEDAPPVRAA